MRYGMVYNFIRMFDFRLPKGRRFNSVTKSNTAVNLPGITKTITHDSDHKKNRSTYLDTISHISSNVEYEKKDTFYVNKEQNTLKTILKKMNKDTMDLIDNMKPKKSPRVVSKEHVSLTVERQVQNNKKVVTILKHQIEKLKQKYSRIVDHQEQQQIIKNISITKEEIDKLKQINLEQKVSVNKDGNQIVREYSQSSDQKLMILETDHQLTHMRLERLKADVQRVREENRSLMVKNQEADPFIEKLDIEMSKIKMKKSEENELRSRELTYQEKKLHLQNIKKKMDFYKNFGQVRYYKGLKELESENSICQMIQTKTIQLEQRNKFIKEELGKLEIEFAELKRRKKEKGRAVQQYLENQRKSRVVETSRIQDFSLSSENIKREVLKTQSEVSRSKDTSEVPKFEQIKIQDKNRPLSREHELISDLPIKDSEREVFEEGNL